MFVDGLNSSMIALSSPKFLTKNFFELEDGTNFHLLAPKNKL